MTIFEKVLIGLVSTGVVGLALVAVLYPVGSATRSPSATFAPSGSGDELESVAARAAARGQTVARIASNFHRYNYDMATIRAGKSPVPPLFLTAFPFDIVQIRQPKSRKNFFFKMVLPLVLRVNDSITRDRRRLIPLLAASRGGMNLRAEDRLWLAAKLDQYGVHRAGLAELAQRIDTVPPSLAIAQAAEESGWGTSRFVREGNALFGQWTFGSAGGLVPRNRDAGKLHKVKAFQNLTQAVGAYAANLNTHRAYRKFRAERARMRAAGRQLDGEQLARTLVSYSERGRAYVATIQNIIRVNRLGQLDAARLGATGLAPAKDPAI